MSKRPLIIDCDPGIDDAQAIMLCKGSEQFDILGITTVAGNVSLDIGSKNAAYIADLIGLQCPIARGAAKPLIFEMPKDGAHGSSGLGDIEVPESSRDFYNKPAWELIYEKAVEYEGKLEILAIGPLTNLAIAVLKYPRLTEYVRRVVVMGGAAKAGNITPYAEFNAYQDPFAASIVFDAGFKSVIMVDLQACGTAYLTDEEAECVGDCGGPIGETLTSIVGYRKRMNLERLAKMPAETRELLSGRNGACDAAAAAVLTVPSIAKIEPYYVICETQSGLSYGQTIIDWNNRFNAHPNVNLTVEIDRNMYAQLYLACMENLTFEEDVIEDEPVPVVDTVDEISSDSVFDDAEPVLTEPVEPIEYIDDVEMVDEYFVPPEDTSEFEDLETYLGNVEYVDRTEEDANE